jgi:hypothetical protein
MPIDLTGIVNENEFFSQHYLDSLFENDIRERQNQKKLSGLASDYRRFIKDFDKAPTGKGLEIFYEWSIDLFAALGYELRRQNRPIEGIGSVEIWGAWSAVQQDGPDIVLVPFWQSLPEVDEEVIKADPLNLTQPGFHYSGDKILQKILFGETAAPRWVIVHGPSQSRLIDRNKWNQRRAIAFEWDELFGRREVATLRATEILLDRESLLGVDGQAFIDRLDENSHKHAYGVSEDLKYALRESIELLGNEAVRYLREVRREKVFEGALDAAQLSRECLRYMYRLLFLFYLEARPELGYIPDSELYNSGYGLETLRELEMIRLTTEESQNGFFYHESLKRLFSLVFNGWPEAREALGYGDSKLRIEPLKCHLFDPARTPLLETVKFRNSVLQQIVRLMSLTRVTGRRSRGRISYRQLGINQLGAVYEALLSFQGFFADEELYEVTKPSGAVNDRARNGDDDDSENEGEEPVAEGAENDDPLANAWFVPKGDIRQYRPEEIVCVDGRPKTYPKGSFIYRLAGRDRQKSASYYTPEILTKTLVKYALKEALEGKNADDILSFTVCEPAMGSAAFLNEAVNQLADAYLERKQAETGKRVPPEAWEGEKQRVRMYLADNNVFGVDLNPTAVELAEVSLWLNSIFEGAFVPWFGLQLHCGNSLIGARRDAGFVGSFKRVAAAESPSAGDIWHFLLADAGMVAYKDKVVGEMEKDRLKLLSDWRKRALAPLEKSEISRLQRLSGDIEKLWKEHESLLRKAREKTRDQLSVWPEPPAMTTPRSTAEKDRILERELFSKDLRNSSPYRRLKAVMDYWCALWFWPIAEAELIPERDEWWMQLELIIRGDVYDTNAARYQPALFSDTLSAEEVHELQDAMGYVDLEALEKKFPALRIVRDLSERYHFFHWDLEFADVFADRGGFDLVLGNPPWIKVAWTEGGVLSDYDPLLILRRFTAPETAQKRDELFTRHPEAYNSYLREYENAIATAAFLNAENNYPELKGSQSNLYKCFLPLSWRILNTKGVSSFLHPEGVYNDPNGGKLRRGLYPRLRYHFQFQNELKLFPIANRAKFGINIYGKKKDLVNGFTIANIFHPSTIDQCIIHSGNGSVPGIKNNKDAWDLCGHRDRIVPVNTEALTLFASLYGANDTVFIEARLPALHTVGLLEVLKKFHDYPRRLGDIKKEYESLEMWHETNAQRDGTIRRGTQFATDVNQWILSGPHFQIATPFFQTPKSICNTHRAYDQLDLIQLPEDYLPRTNYFPACISTVYSQRTPTVPWDEKKRVTEYFRLTFRRQLSQDGERTLIPIIVIRKASHINTVFSICFQDIKKMISLCTIASSLCCDFFVKSTGKGDFRDELASLLPLPEVSLSCSIRTLSLNCLTTHYSELWSEAWEEAYTRDSWTKSDPRLDNVFFAKLNPQWKRDCALRTPFERRQALVELDVLAARELKLSLDQLLDIYRIQFPVLRQYEADTWYDQKGRIVFTVNKSLSGVGLPRHGNLRQHIVGWEDVRDMESGTVSQTIMDDTLPGGPREKTIVYYAPFTRCSREEDYRTAWDEFERRGL